jgi:hypothetical protein
MTCEIDASDSLSRAIGEFREELLLWIDAELVRLGEREQDDSVIEEEPRRSHSNGLSGRLGMSSGSPFFQSGSALQEPGTSERVVDRPELAVQTVWPSVPLPKPSTDAELRLPVSNPRQRLDALARLLDQRVKQAQGLAETNGSTGNGTNDGADVDTPSSSVPEGRR